MKKIKAWIKNKLREFLGVDTLSTDINNIDRKLIATEIENSTTFNNLQNRISNSHTSLKGDISHFQESVNTLHRTVENVVHIGTDVDFHPNGHSWAVVCVEGKINIVKFIPLDRQDARSILDFLKQFGRGRHCIDAPSRLMFDELFKF